MTQSNDDNLFPDQNIDTADVTNDNTNTDQPGPLKNGNFVKLWLGQTISNIGSFFAFIAIIFFTLRLSSHLPAAKQAQALALVTLIQLIPSVVVGPFSGVIVDRFDRKKIMVVMDLVGASTSFAMTLVSQIWQIYAMVSLYTFVRIFFYPAKQAALPMIVDPENIMQANSLSQTTMQLSKIIGPALSGFVIAIYGIHMAFIIDGVSFVVSALSISIIGVNLKPKPQTDKLTAKSAIVDLRKGFSIAWNNRVIRYIFGTMILFMVGASMVDPLFAFYLKVQFGLSEQDFGLILSFSALSGLVSAIILSSKSDIQRKLLLILSTLLIAAVSLLFIGLAPILPFPVIALYLGMALIGMVNVVLMIPMSTLIQTIVETDDMGKVNGIMGALISLTQVGGAALAGGLIAYVSVSVIYTSIGVFLAGLFGILLFVLVKYDIEAESQQQQEKMIKVKREQHAIRQDKPAKDSIPVAPEQIPG